jgi:sn-glycerol 3-phosphate transport system substrate-binding protein
MLWHTTGSLTSILKDAKFPVGVGFLPGLKQNGAPTGGGNFYVFKKTPPDKQQAAWKFIQFMASPEIQARWTVDTGYIAARKSAWDTATLKDYAVKAPQVLVAREQLPFAGKELSTHQGPQLQQLLGNQVQAALTGKKSAQQAIEDAQKDADKILAQFKD